MSTQQPADVDFPPCNEDAEFGLSLDPCEHPSINGGECMVCGASFGEPFEVEPPSLDEQIAEAERVWAEAEAEHKAAWRENSRLKELGAAASERESKAFTARKQANDRLMALVHERARGKGAGQ